MATPRREPQSGAEHSWSEPRARAQRSWRPSLLRATAAALDAFARRSTPDCAQAVPPLAIAILAVGSRGDIQPFLPIAARLQRDGHRVRLATHAVFRNWVESHGVEFFPLAGDPRELMEYMVMTGGRLLPRNLDQLVDRVPRMRAMVAEILRSTWLACTEPDPDRPGAAPFVADALIANPPSQGHIHVAEALRAPLHMMFTMPWSPTRAARHPFTPASSTPPPGLLNRLSFVAFDLVTWLGTGDLVNEFREKTLGTEHISLEGAGLLHGQAVPHSYLWSPSLLEKPEDWAPHLEVTGFVFPEDEQTFEPPEDLSRFLSAGPPPVYVGFGSCPHPDPEALTRTIWGALEQAGARGLVSRGWAHLGNVPVPPHVMLVDEVPHDWLFPRCAAVCHHGGAGTTAMGLRAGRPTMVVPFFGDQYFWGRIVAEAGAGPAPIPVRELTASALADAIAFCRRPEAQERARALGERVRGQSGAEAAVAAFYRWLPLAAMRCALDPGHLARRFCDDCDLALCRTCDHVVHQDAATASHQRHPYGHVGWDLAAASTIERLQQAFTSPLAGHGDDAADLATKRIAGVALRDPSQLAAQLHAGGAAPKVGAWSRARILARFVGRRSAAHHSAHPAPSPSVGQIEDHSSSRDLALEERLVQSRGRVLAWLRRDHRPPAISAADGPAARGSTNAPPVHPDGRSH